MAYKFKCYTSICDGQSVTEKKKKKKKKFLSSGSVLLCLHPLALMPGDGLCEMVTRSPIELALWRRLKMISSALVHVSHSTYS